MHGDSIVKRNHLTKSNEAEPHYGANTPNISSAAPQPNEAVSSLDDGNKYLSKRNVVEITFALEAIDFDMLGGSLPSRAVLLLLLILTHVFTTAADQSQARLQDASGSQARTHRVAIIGAGPGGSAASYYLDRFSSQSDSDVALDITVLEANRRIGGRTTTVDALDDPRYPTELGASIFVKINHILYNATRDFGLAPCTKVYDAEPESKYELGIWDGRQFVFRTAAEGDGGGDNNKGSSSSWRGWWDVAKLLWKYGLSPIRTRRATNAALGTFLKFYDQPLFPFQSLQEVVDQTGLDDYTAVSGREVLRHAGVSDLFSREIVQASTRVNYASNLGGIHGLETLVCMAIEGAMAIEGGNWQIFHEMVKRSASRVLLNTTVTDIILNPHTETYRVRTDDPDIDAQFNAEAYDSVILAAPYQFANISFTPPLVDPPVKVDYVSLYVTLLTSPHRLSPSFFGLESQADVPASVLTTLPEDLNDALGSRRGIDAVGPSGFWSISTLRVLHPDTDGLFFGPTATALKNGSSEVDSEPPISESQPQYLYKIFSPAPLTGSFVSFLLGIPYKSRSDSPSSQDLNDDPVGALPKEHITWLHEKHWHSYPYEIPRHTFDNFTLHMSEPEPFAAQNMANKSAAAHRDTVIVDDQTTTCAEQCYGKTCPDSGIYYLSSMESFISTMETSALAGMNVARLLVDTLERCREN
ncbi:hypothetical protein ABEF95_006743 [Exophiala dermatitidis]